MRKSGTVKFFNKEKGFGFIAPDDGGKDIFVHVSIVHKGGIPYLEDGMKLSFDVQPDTRGRGPQAINLLLS
jgi:cold shock protein